MKDFLKFTLATVTGIILSSIDNRHGNAVWYHGCFGYGNDSQKELRYDT